MGTQSEYQYLDKPAICLICNCTPECKIKKACVKLLLKCGISTSMATVAAKAVCEELYHHQYYMTKEEVIEKDPNLAQYKKQTSSSPKKGRLDEPKQPLKPMFLKKDYAPYKDV